MSNLVIIGSPMEQQTVVGPFECFDAADTWCAENLTKNQFTWIITLSSPEEYEET